MVEEKQPQEAVMGMTCYQLHFLSHGIRRRWVYSPLHHCQTFPPMVHSQCTHDSRVGSKGTRVGWNLKMFLRPAAIWIVNPKGSLGGGGDLWWVSVEVVLYKLKLQLRIIAYHGFSLVTFCQRHLGDFGRLDRGRQGCPGWWRRVEYPASGRSETMEGAGCFRGWTASTYPGTSPRQQKQAAVVPCDVIVNTCSTTKNHYKKPLCHMK